jgi:beta-N-acetylhexosaminidase
MKYRARRWRPPRSRSLATAGALAAVCALTMTGLAGAPGAGQARAATAALRAAPSLARAVSGLSDSQLAGQRVIYTYQGINPPPALLTLVRHGEAAGVVFFTQNVGSPPHLAVVARELQQASDAATNPVREPLLLMTDQEGGLVRRLPGAPVASQQQIGQSADPLRQAGLAGAGAAQTLRAAGLNVNLAPVLDVYRSPTGFIQTWGRSYSHNPRVAGRLGAAFIAAQQAGRVLAVAKHFPGLGSARHNQDTDNEPVTLGVPAATLRGTDELPYRPAVAAGLRMVMLSWAVYPALDPSRPAGLSPVVINGELRQRLGFSGVTMTDALEAGALGPFGGIGHRAVLAAQAGEDLLLTGGRRLAEGRRALAALAAGYADGRLSRTAALAAVTRIVALRAALAGPARGQRAASGSRKP